MITLFQVGILVTVVSHIVVRCLTNHNDGKHEGVGNEMHS